VRRLYQGVIVILAVILVAFVAQKVFGGKSVEPRLVASQPTAMIGSGSSAVAVAANGTILAWLPPPEDGSLPKLPLEVPPKGPRLQGPVLEQALVLGAAPEQLRPYIEGSYYGESGVDVNLTSGIELRFGNATQADRKWRAAAAVLADPTLTAVDYVDLHDPERTSTYGSGHTLPPIP
jgi:Cell division protein FtsQ/DivIB, C-terminal